VKLLSPSASYRDTRTDVSGSGVGVGIGVGVGSGVDVGFGDGFGLGELPPFRDASGGVSVFGVTVVVGVCCGEWVPGWPVTGFMRPGAESPPRLPSFCSRLSLLSRIHLPPLQDKSSVSHSGVGVAVALGSGVGVSLRA